MSFETPGPGWTLEAAADLSAKQFHFVIVDGDGRAAMPGGDGVMSVGVLQNDPLQFGSATIVDRGTVKVVSNGTIEIGDPVAAANGGRGKEAASGEYVQGTALEGDGGDAGAIIAVLLRPQGRLA